LFDRLPELPVRSHADVNGISQVSRRSILCLCPALRPRPNRRPLASWRFRRCCPRTSHGEGFSGWWISGLYHAALAPAAYASRTMLPPSLQDSLPAGWLAFAGRASTLWIAAKGFRSSILLFWTWPGAREVSLW